MNIKRTFTSLLIVLFATPIFALKASTKTSIDVSAEKKYEMTIKFLKSYDKDFSIVDWKVRVKKNKVIMSKYGSLERLELFNHYFVELTKKEQSEKAPLQ